MLVHRIGMSPRSTLEPAANLLRRLPTPPHTAGELVERALSGDRWASEALYRRHVDDVIRVATFLLGRTHEVDDVVQDAFLQAFDKLEQLRDANAFGGWVARIAANRARGVLRRRKLRRLVGLDRGEDDASLEHLAAPGATPEQRAELAVLARALDGLSADARMAWTLRHVEGWSLEETAAAIGVSLATIKRRLQAADRAVRSYRLGGHGGEP